MDEPWDPDKARANLRKHGVSFEEALTVDADPGRQTTLDAAHSGLEDRFHVVGVSAAGRILQVTCSFRDARMRPITARRAMKRECHDYLRGAG